MTFIRLPLIIFILILSLTSTAETSIWEVSNGKNTVYLGGTFHMLKPSDYPLPKEFLEIYNKVEWLVFETDITQLKTDEFQQKLIKAMTLTNGQVLPDQLSPHAYAGLIRYAAKNDIDMGPLQHFRPQMIALMISLKALRKLGLTAEGVDGFLGDKALTDEKKITELESIDEQINFIATMGEDNESALILQTLDDINDFSDDLTIMKDAWRSGNSKSLFETGIKPMKESYPTVYQSLLVDRNNNWLPKIERLIEQPKEKFILVGALHLIGADGLLQQLNNRGYQVQRYIGPP
jgi:uncharacterized protein YbaP (TraB family)